MTRFSGVRRFFRLPREEHDTAADVASELDFHIEMRVRDLAAAGMPERDARAEALRRFGDVHGARAELTRIDEERMHTQRRAEWWSTSWQDLGFAARVLRRSPGFTLIAVLTLALGIGGSTAIFSVVDAVLLRPLPYPEPERLVVPRTTNRGQGNLSNVTMRDYLSWREQQVFEHVGIWQEPELDITAGDGEPRRVKMAVVTDGFFPALGVRPVLGRLFSPDEFSPSSERPLVISHPTWQARFAGDPRVIGRSIRISGLPATIVGVLPRHASFPRDVDVWYPFRARPEASLLAADNFIFWSVARLRDDASLPQTRAKLDAMARAVEQEFPQKRANTTVTAIPLREYIVGAELERALWIMLGAVGVVLLIGCVNVANLLLVRASTREQELAIRTALGAGRGRLVRQLFTESVLLASAGCALGVLVAILGIGALKRWAPSDLPLLTTVQLNGSVLAFAVAIAALSVLVFGLAPALQASSAHPGHALGGPRTTAGARSRRAASALVMGELALSLVLLSGAGLLIRSFTRLMGVDTGMQRIDRVITFQASLPARKYDSTHKQLAFWDRLVQRLETIPGVQSASVSSTLPIGGGGFYLGRTLIQEGAPEPPAGKEVGIMWTAVSPGYFTTMGQALLAGRDFTARDDSTAPAVIIVNQRFVEEMFPDDEVLGKRVISWRDERRLREIVGIVGNVRYDGMSDDPRPIVYVPVGQQNIRPEVVQLRTAGDPAAAVASIRRELRALDPEIAMARVATMNDVVSQSVTRPRFSATLLSGFAVFA
ncbi:MAG TPA: ABC transporter permease, partial [Gemmatimonadaceae bacterium]|nr:ABC transporter permease [Gemmatimonadaceae bacterium]